MDSNPPKSSLKYGLPSATEPQERERLDGVQEAFAAYFEGKLALSPVGNPKNILDLGAGSGAWAIHAAKTYPEAEVLAVDIRPLPDRPLPANLQFRQLNLTEELPFTPGSFDIVHFRFVLIHVPNHRAVLHKAIRLLKSGGYILIEDLDHYLHGENIAEEAQIVFRIVNEYNESYNADLRAGYKHKSSIEATQLCDDVSETRIRLPFSPGIDAEPKLKSLAESAKRFNWLAYLGMASSKVPALTDDVMQAFKKDMEDPNHEYWFDLYAVSARKI